MGTDASVVFNALSVGTVPESSALLWCAPRRLKSRLIEMIDTETAKGNKGFIAAKINGITDTDIIEKLVRAGKAGVKIELLVRGICCLIAGVKGETENITVCSVIGRFLEHSRVYIFGMPDTPENQKIYISSADFMTRNTEKRVEIAAPVLNEEIKDRIRQYFNIMIRGNSKAWYQQPDGAYKKPAATEPNDSINLSLLPEVYVSEMCRDELKDAQRLLYMTACERAEKTCKIKGLFGGLKKWFG
jgi:polyphosphate kinase